MGQRERARHGVVDPRVVDQRVDPHQRRDGDGVGGGDGAIEELLGPDDERLGIAAGREEASGLVVPEQVEEIAGHHACPFAPDAAARPLGETDTRLDQPGMIGRDGKVPRPAALPAAHQPALRVHGGEKEVADLLGATPVALVAGRCRDLGQRRRLPWRSTR